MKLKIEKDQETNEPKYCFFEKMNNSDKPPARLTKKKRKKNTVSGTTEGVITTNLTERKGIIKEYYKQCYKHKFDHFDVMNPVLDNTN